MNKYPTRLDTNLWRNLECTDVTNLPIDRKTHDATIRNMAASTWIRSIHDIRLKPHRLNFYFLYTHAWDFPPWLFMVDSNTFIYLPMMTFNFKLANFCATWKPIPLVAPVTMATVSPAINSLISCSMLSFHSVVTHPISGKNNTACQLHDK